MKYYLSAFFACVAMFASGKTCTWTGLGDGVTYANASNWDNGVPAAGDTVVFQPQGSLFVAFSAASAAWAQARFESGNTVLGFAPGLKKANLNFSKTCSIYVAEGATATVSNRVAGVESGTQMEIDGGGGITFYSDYVDNVGYFNLIDIKSGVVTYAGGGGEGGRHWRSRLTRVRDGAVFNVSGAGLDGKASNGHVGWPSVQIDKGGVADFYASGKAVIGSIFGGGTLRIGKSCSFTFVQDYGPAAFGGDVEYYDNGTLTIAFARNDDVPASNFSYTLASCDAFADVTVSDCGALRFAPGVGTYSIGRWADPSGETALCVEDTAGDPITVYTAAADHSTFRATGSGSLMLTSGIAITGSVVSVGGTLGFVNPLSSYRLGDGVDPANDADLSTLSRLVIGTSGATGLVTFQNCTPTQLDIPVSGTGNVSVCGSYTFSQFAVKGSSQMSLSVDGDLATDGPDGQSQFFVNLVDRYSKWSVLGGEWYRGFKTNSLDTISSLPYRQGVEVHVVTEDGGTLSVSNALFYADKIVSTDGEPNLQVLSGGKFVQNGPYSPFAGATPESPLSIFLDGGTFRCSLLNVHNYSPLYIFGVPAVSSNVLVSVGAHGAKIGAECEGSQLGYTLKMNAKVVSAAAPDGGLTREVFSGTLAIMRPLSIAGPFTSLDGIVSIDPVYAPDLAENPSWLGTGPVTLRNSVIDLSPLGAGSELDLASATGGALAYSGMAAIKFSAKADAATRAKHVAVGATGASGGASLVRAGRGSLLYLWDHKPLLDGGLFDGTASSITVRGGLPLSPSGVAKDPVVVYSSYDNRCYFATCAPDGSIRPFDGYTTSFDADACTSDDIVMLTAAASVPGGRDAYVGGLKLSGISADFTVGAGATLHVGNGTDPALVIVDKPGVKGAGGSVDFGTSEGMFVGIGESTVIEPVLKGSGGISFVSPPNLPSAVSDYRSVRLRGANRHSGGTYVNSMRVNAENAAAFGAGDVYVGGGHDYGGRIYFNTPNLVFTNGFHIAGWGKHEALESDGGAYGYGALSFAADTEISGGVEIVEPARMCCINSGDRAVLSGEVSGDRITVYSGAGVVAFTHANSYTGGTEIVAATLEISEAGTLGSGGVLLDGGTLVIDKPEDFSLPNRISGMGTVRLEGKARVSFDGGLDVDDYGGLVSGNFTLDLSGRRRVIVPSLDGFSAVTSEREGPVDLYVEDGKAFSGTLSANIVFHAGGYRRHGSVLIVR